jgi:hypothetical protein
MRNIWDATCDVLLIAGMAGIVGIAARTMTGQPWVGGLVGAASALVIFFGLRRWRGY